VGEGALASAGRASGCRHPIAGQPDSRRLALNARSDPTGGRSLRAIGVANHIEAALLHDQSRAGIETTRGVRFENGSESVVEPSRELVIKRKSFGRQDKWGATEDSMIGRWIGYGEAR